jgi:hypothetical protein
MQCAQSNDKSGYAGFRSEEVTEGVKMKAWIAIHSRTDATAMGIVQLHNELPPMTDLYMAQSDAVSTVRPCPESRFLSTQEEPF